MIFIPKRRKKIYKVHRLAWIEQHPLDSHQLSHQLSHHESISSRVLTFRLWRSQSLIRFWQCHWIHRPTCCSGAGSRRSSCIRPDSHSGESKAANCWRKWVNDNFFKFILSVSDHCPLVVAIIGETDKPDGWVNIVKDLDAVIDCVGGSADIAKLSELLFTAISNAAKQLRPQGAPKLTYIYTSGTWVHGDNREDVITDTTPIRSPAELVAWRPTREQAIIHDQTVNGIVIRPGLLYGRSGSLLAPFFKSASEGKVWYPGKPGGRFALIHTDDLADLFLRAVERASICGGRIFDATNDITESADDVLAALAKVSGAKTYEYREPQNGMFFPLWLDSRLRVAD